MPQEKSQKPNETADKSANEDISFLWKAMSQAQDEVKDVLKQYKKASGEASLLKKELTNTQKILNEKLKLEQELESCDSLKAQLDGLKKDLESKDKIIANKEIYEARLKNDIQEIVLKLNENKISLGKAIGPKSQLLEKIHALDENLADANKVLAVEIERNSSLSKKLDSQNLENERLAKSARELSEKLGNEQQISHASLNKISVLQTEIDKLLRESAAAKNHNNALVNEINKRKNEISELTRRCQEQVYAQQRQSAEATAAAITAAESIFIPPMTPEPEPPAAVSTLVPDLLIGHIKKPLENIISNLKSVMSVCMPDLQAKIHPIIRNTGSVLDLAQLWEEYSDVSDWTQESCHLKTTVNQLLDLWD